METITQVVLPPLKRMLYPPTLRELQILALKADGYTGKEVADGLGIAESTVKNTLTAIYTKLGAESERHAIAIAMRKGWLK